MLSEVAQRSLGPWPARVLFALACGIFVFRAFSVPESVIVEHAVRPVERGASPASRLVIIGLDSADWAVIDPLLDAGELPALARLIDRGRTAVLLSVEPSISPVVWTSIFSSREPEDHGIRDWFAAHAANRRVGLLWDMAAAAGLESIVVNVPGTWPPNHVSGALISGFPIPNALLHPDRDLVQNVGMIVARAPRPGPLYTQVIPGSDEGVGRADIRLGVWQAPPRGRVDHFALDWAIEWRWLPLPVADFALALHPLDAEDRMPIEVAGQRIVLARNETSPWLSVATVAGPLELRMTRLPDDALLVTPAFQLADAPIHAFADSAETREVVTRAGRYVVEPAGWRSVDDPAARGALFDHLVDVEQMHLGATLALMDAVPDWALLVYVLTLPDRASHAFWPFYRSDDYGGELTPGDARDAERVSESYRASDRMVGRLLDRVGDDATVLIISDHGSASKPGRYGGHRIEGILAAAGPGIEPDARRSTASIMDVTPLALSLLGLPLALDFGGAVPDGFAVAPTTAATLPSYEIDGAGESSSPEKIDESTREQLRGLGYIE
jgi:hypothetical protein